MTLRREALLSAALAAAVASLLAWLGPPGTDFAAHAYQRTLFLEHGFSIWNNWWYAGRYSFITYSVLYYPLAALLGIRLLAVATIALAALAFAVVLGREWGPAARWSSRTFAVIWAGIVLSAAFPFALGMALALLALWALQTHARWRFGVLALLTLAASPVAFLLLAVMLAGVALARRPALVPAVTIAAVASVEIVLWRLFPGGGRFPFSGTELVAALLFCGAGVVLTWRVDRVLCAFFGVYLAVCVGAYLIPSSVGENAVRLRFAALPIYVLIFSLRRWRPRWIAVVILAGAVAFNVSPLASSYVKGSADKTEQLRAWVGAIRFLRTHLGPGYRVEAVDTATHWPAAYLADAHIPIARGWFRQDDFPTNEVLYGKLGVHSYVAWLHALGVRYVVRAHAQPDYSARAEAAIAKRLHAVYRSREVTIYIVPGAVPIARGLLALSDERMRIAVRKRGTLRIAVKYSPYWHASKGCLSEGKDGMLRLSNLHPRVVTIVFDVSAGRALRTLAGERPDCDLRQR